MKSSIAMHPPFNRCLNWSVKLKSILLLGLVFLSSLAALASSLLVTPADFKGARQPQIAVDAEGRIFVAFGRTNSIYVTVSEDGGKHFNPPVKVGEVGKLALGMRRGPRIVTAGDLVTVTGISHEDGNLYAWVSADAGRTWAQPVTINNVKTSAREGMHGLASDGKQNLFAVWLDLRNTKTELWGAASADGGKTWGNNQQLYRSPDQSICECCHPSAIYTPQGEIVVMWRNWLSGNRDMYRSISLDGGKTFSPATKLGSGSWRLSGCPMDGGQLAASGDQISYVWRREQRLFITSDISAETLLTVNGTHPLVIGTDRGFEYIWQNQGNLYAKSTAANESKLLAANASYASAVWSPKYQETLVVWEDSIGVHFSKRP